MNSWIAWQLVIESQGWVLVTIHSQLRFLNVSGALSGLILSLLSAVLQFLHGFGIFNQMRLLWVSTLYSLKLFFVGTHILSIITISLLNDQRSCIWIYSWVWVRHRVENMRSTITLLECWYLMVPILWREIRPFLGCYSAWSMRVWFRLCLLEWINVLIPDGLWELRLIYKYIGSFCLKTELVEGRHCSIWWLLPLLF